MPSRAPLSAAEKPKRIPVLPLRDSVHFPGLLNTVHVARDLSVRAVRSALDRERVVLCITQEDGSIDEPDATNLSKTGTVCEVLQAAPLPDGSLRGIFRGSYRAVVRRLVRGQGCLWAEVEQLLADHDEVIEVEALARECAETFARLAPAIYSIPPEAIEAVLQAPVEATADTIAHYYPFSLLVKQQLLEQAENTTRLEVIYELLRKEDRLQSVREKIRSDADAKIGASQREFILREQLSAIYAELYGSDSSGDELELLRERIVAADLSREAEGLALREWRTLRRTSADSAEATVIRTHLDWLLSLPWNTSSPEEGSLREVENELNTAHFGLTDLKQRVLEYLAVRSLGGAISGNILLFDGPPGVGKTSFARAIAKALKRPFASIALGGLKDEAELRGHRRTYVGAMPGRILQALRNCGANNPVFLLDELDKVSSDTYRGDPAGVLLEILDPEQNKHFVDSYLEAPFDLSKIFFIGTANDVAAIPRALRDRLEIHSLPSYSDAEKMEIAAKHLLPNSLAAHGIDAEKFQMDPTALQRVIRDYSAEAGVRLLERNIRALCRKASWRIATGDEHVFVAAEELPQWMGPPSQAGVVKGSEVGCINALVVSPIGGQTITIEVALMDSEDLKPSLRLTGNLGAVMRESAETALGFIRSASGAKLRGRDVHVHATDAGVAKEGPSAGLAVAAALYSAAHDVPIPGNVAVTGEVSLRGKVLPVGGIREKLMAAHREGIRHVYIPASNHHEMLTLPAETKDALTIHLVSTADELLSALFPKTAAVSLP